jgi:hypothetical protein
VAASGVKATLFSPGKVSLGTPMNKSFAGATIENLKYGLAVKKLDL